MQAQSAPWKACHVRPSVLTFNRRPEKNLKITCTNDSPGLGKSPILISSPTKPFPIRWQVFESQIPDRCIPSPGTRTAIYKFTWDLEIRNPVNDNSEIPLLGGFELQPVMDPHSRNLNVPSFSEAPFSRETSLILENPSPPHEISPPRKASHIREIIAQRAS